MRALAVRRAGASALWPRPASRRQSRARQRRPWPIGSGHGSSALLYSPPARTMQRGREPQRPAFPYLRVLEALRQDVLASAPGSAAPSEAELATRHGVSRMTARNAVLVLRQEGLLYVV